MWAATSRGLQRRVDATATEVFNAATASSDTASDHLVLAWSGAYGRNPHPASAWHHSIKALEASLQKIVCPSTETATLPFIIDQLKTGQWNLQLRGQARDHAIDPLIKMLELVWPDPNRHGTHAHESPATREEAGAVVLLAVTIVQWARNGQIIKR